MVGLININQEEDRQLWVNIEEIVSIAEYVNSSTIRTNNRTTVCLKNGDTFNGTKDIDVLVGYLRGIPL